MAVIPMVLVMQDELKVACCSRGHMIVIPKRCDHCVLCYDVSFRPALEALKEEGQLPDDFDPSCY